MLEKVKDFARNKATQFRIAAGITAATAGGAIMAIAAGAEGETTANTFSVPLISQSVTTDMMSGIMEQITSLLPIILPVLVGVLAFRKGLSFFIGMIRGL